MGAPAPGLHLSQRVSTPLSQTMPRAVELLQLGNAELSGFLIEAAARNPALTVRLPSFDASPDLQSSPNPQSGANPKRGADPKDTSARRGFRGTPAGLAAAHGFDPDTMGAQAARLHDHVQRQIGQRFSAPAERRIAQAFVEALDPSGWLGDRLAEVARVAGCGEAGCGEAAEAVLIRLQGLDPAGLFARSRAESLRLQLADQGALGAPMQALLDDLPALARGDTGLLLARCGVDAAELGRMVTRLRGLDPKPGAQFDTSPAQRRAPDLVVARDAGGRWQVGLNPATLPEVGVARRADPGNKAGLATARWLERAVARRNQMILRVASYVIAAQHDFLDRGVTRLRPLTSVEVGVALGLQETTVGRIRNALRVQVSGRVLPLSAFFRRGRVACAGGATLAGDAIGGLIAALVAAERPEAPLSDMQLVNRLALRGVSLSRRTLANWRNRAGIAPALERKRAAGER